MRHVIITTLTIVFSALMLSCQQTETLSREVEATAYNSLPEQTHHHHPSITAWGDTLKPGMKAIAVSRDLIKLGLTHGTTVRIEGLEGEYKVLDKMNRRWENKIDIYMGEDLQKALNWGRKTVTISWEVEKP